MSFYGQVLKSLVAILHSKHPPFLLIPPAATLKSSFEIIDFFSLSISFLSLLLTTIPINIAINEMTIELTENIIHM